MSKDNDEFRSLMESILGGPAQRRDDKADDGDTPNVVVHEVSGEEALAMLTALAGMSASTGESGRSLTGAIEVLLHAKVCENCAKSLKEEWEQATEWLAEQELGDDTLNVIDIGITI